MKDFGYKLVWLKTLEGNWFWTNVHTNKT